MDLYVIRGLDGIELPISSTRSARAWHSLLAERIKNKLFLGNLDNMLL
uniref:Uncharacterized protein n=1 Tax=Utricularia reniformis TaxID=192314 RepID=A0A1Y0B158_9LAMI|nr:hypothetical protein AEK19_MT0857 [Utricularia reniformis]YP_009382279.1 hypothetical protein AEK19_MT1852 [Utricularia reniformis]ART31089.1 hypothetical protein AEK19_MT0857 [Utricularia reniformis]ART32022.1 hypothetical protein AEK19_MT1852 [Utricularia reniformis]